MAPGRCIVRDVFLSVFLVGLLLQYRMGRSTCSRLDISASLGLLQYWCVCSKQPKLREADSLLSECLHKNALKNKNNFAKMHVLFCRKGRQSLNTFAIKQQMVFKMSIVAIYPIIQIQQKNVEFTN